MLITLLIQSLSSVESSEYLSVYPGRHNIPVRIPLAEHLPPEFLIREYIPLLNVREDVDPAAQRSALTPDFHHLRYAGLRQVIPEHFFWLKAKPGIDNKGTGLRCIRHDRPDNLIARLPQHAIERTVHACNPLKERVFYAIKRQLQPACLRRELNGETAFTGGGDPVDQNNPFTRLARRFDVKSRSVLRHVPPVRFGCVLAHGNTAESLPEAHSDAEWPASPVWILSRCGRAKCSLSTVNARR